MHECAVQQKLIQHCKSTILQSKNFLKGIITRKKIKMKTLVLRAKKMTHEVVLLCFLERRELEKRPENSASVLFSFLTSYHFLPSHLLVLSKKCVSSPRFIVSGFWLFLTVLFALTSRSKRSCMDVRVRL